MAELPSSWDVDLPETDRLIEETYTELHRIARVYLRRERPGQTLQATGLLHEAYLRLRGARRAWTDRRHFVAIGANVMRRILVERARARHARKRWGDLDRVSLTRALAQGVHVDEMLPELDEALARLEARDPQLVRIVELRYFGGLSITEAAEALDMSPATLKRRWALAKAWLFRELGGTPP